MQYERNLLDAAPALWAGVECTVNRVGDRFCDQLEWSGHAARLDDLDRFAALGIRTLRYPVLWERVAPNGLAQADWSWPDERLERLRALGIRPIVGLVHHGSGPRHTSLVDATFASKLAAFAGAVATRYPWVRDYTPVNEPLTTARFSALYGHWYPHARDDASFVRALVSQCRAVVLAMRAIRRVQPAARLIQTEDLGKTWATPALAKQAAFENERRWLSLDLLCGRLERQHPLWGYLRDAGASAEELAWFQANPCPPDIIGVNTYVTSERFLDERLEHYPVHTHGGNGQQTYADVEAVRVRGAGVEGPRGLLAEAWARYGRPLAVTEAHLGCTREEQLRWLVELWQAVGELRHQGVPVVAVTAWSLLGAYDWNSLVTRPQGVYEPGVFDVRGPAPRPTALAGIVRALCAGEAPQHPTLHTPGWWHRPERFQHSCPCADLEEAEQGAASNPSHAEASRAAASHNTRPQPLLVLGAGGTLGRAFTRICHERGLAFVGATHAELEITDLAAVQTALTRYRPWAVVNAAGYVRVEDAEQEWGSCLLANTVGPALLADACAEHDVQLLTFSTDLVFDGAERRPYLEHDAVAPLNAYGRSKVMAERYVAKGLPNALLVRSSAFFGLWDQANFVADALGKLAAGGTVAAADDVTVSPTYVPDLVHTCLDLLIDDECGLWHLANEGAVSWAELARRVAELAGYNTDLVRPTAGAAPHSGVRLPVYSALGSARGQLLPSLDNALERYMAAWTVAHAAMCG